MRTSILRFAGGVGVLGIALAAAPNRPAATTQKAFISVKAFDDNDPVMSDPQVAKMLQPKIVSLNVEKMPAMQAIAELSKQTGYEIKPPNWGGNLNAGRGGTKVTLSLSNQPFWVVLRELCTRGNLSLYNSGGNENGRTIEIVGGSYNGGAIRAATSIKGPFMVLLSNLERINTVDMANPQQVRRDVQLQLQMYTEPSVHVTAMSWQPVVDDAVDDHGNTMVPPQQDKSNRNMQGSRGVAWYASLRLPYPVNNPGSRIAKLKGHTAAKIELASEPFEITDPLKAVETPKTIGGRRVTFKALKPENKNYRLELMFYRDGQDQQEFNESLNSSPTMHLTDAQGREYAYWSSGWNSQNDMATKFISFRPRDNQTPGEPVKLVIEVPTGTKDVDVPFEIVDLPLP